VLARINWVIMLKLFVTAGTERWLSWVLELYHLLHVTVLCCMLLWSLGFSFAWVLMPRKQQLLLRQPVLCQGGLRTVSGFLVIRVSASCFLQFLMLLVGWEEGHPACRNTCASCPQSFSSGAGGGREPTVQLTFSGKTTVKIVMMVKKCLSCNYQIAW